MRDVIVETLPTGKFTQTIHAGPNTIVADEPLDEGGVDAGPSPFDLVLAGLGACTSMTLKMYAERKGIALEACTVTLRGESKDGVFRIERDVVLHGKLGDAERTRLIEIANKCPVHRALSSKIDIVTRG